MGPYVGCTNCGYKVHYSHASGDYCPRCGSKVSTALDSREFGSDMDQKDKDWKEYQKLKSQFGGR